MKLSNGWMIDRLVLAVGTLCIVFTPSAGAQVQTTTSIREGQGSQVVRVDRGEVLAVEGNDLIVRMDDGSMRHFENIPDSARVTVAGNQLGIHDLKPGMKLQRTITTTTTPQVVTTVETVTGKVWFINAPLSVILTLENGTNQSFKIPKDQKFKVDGQMLDAFGLKKGMVVTATKIVEVPVSVVSQEKSVTGTMPPPAVSSHPAPADTPLLIAEGAPTATPPEATEAAAAPPKTGYLPLLGLGVLLMIIILVVTTFARSKSRA